MLRWAWNLHLSHKGANHASIVVVFWYRNICTVCTFIMSDVFHSSAEELLSEPWILLHTERWHLRPLPVVYHAKRAGEGNAKDEPIQDWYWSCLQPQGKTSYLLYFCMFSSLCVYGLFCCVILTLHPPTHTLTYSRINTTQWSQELSRPWRKSWCLISTWQIMMMSGAAAGNTVLSLISLPLWIAFLWDDSKLSAQCCRHLFKMLDPDDHRNSHPG